VIYVFICVSTIIRTWAPEFILLGGYDQEPGIMPSSQQDVDLKDRAWRAAKLIAQDAFNMNQNMAAVHATQLQKRIFFYLLLMSSIS
jgi:hypothetical protein